ncbi:hypothetical protein [Paucilactobacillus kaifaensis]|uniref:hypothetical protein n=1 Tax=Paucilactobacillus kaifaensis TaxID=2559921 RepID=UPI0010F9095D|nr:hypothetical protein [Paucilactobacillus kaifaensis]
MKVRISAPDQGWLDHFSSDGYQIGQILELSESEYNDLDMQADSFNHEVFGPAIELERTSQ